ncbi:MAG: DNA gyrase inhibitor YacG [Halobacteriovoraceae bacterium]|nr:DNA gyrase inhibitor YacG [Halobacteriovoraceae bacterium]
MKKLEVKCPNCKTNFNYYDSEFRPFCCEKCKMIDMGQWLTEGYKVSGRDYSLYAEDPEKLEELLAKGDLGEDF